MFSPRSPGAMTKPSLSHFFEQFRLDQVHLTPIGPEGCLLRFISVLNEASGVCITLDTVPLDKAHALPAILLNRWASSELTDTTVPCMYP